MIVPLLTHISPIIFLLECSIFQNAIDSKGSLFRENHHDLYKEYLDAEFLGRGANSFLCLLALLTLNQPVTSTEDL